MTGRANIPDWSITLDGKSLTGKIRPRLISMTITEARGDAADQLDLCLDDSDGQLDIPATGAVLTVALGWLQGSDVTTGLVSKGTFKVDEVTHRGPPDTVTIKARSADLSAASLRTRREQCWTNTTLGTVLEAVAVRNGLITRISSALAGVSVPTITQGRESDMALLARLGRMYDAVATIKAGHLIFTRKGAGQTATGKSLPAITIRRRDGDRHTYTVQTRTDYPGVSASWHDKAGATRKTVTAGDKAGAKHIRQVFASETAARQAATAERARLKRSPASLDVGLALGRADASPEMHVTALGYKADIDAREWIITEVVHDLGQNGFTTSLKMETAP